MEKPPRRSKPTPPGFAIKALGAARASFLVGGCDALFVFHKASRGTVTAYSMQAEPLWESQIPERPSQVLLSPDGGSLAMMYASCREEQVAWFDVYDARTGERRWSFASMLAPIYVLQAVFTGDSSRLLVLKDDKLVKVYDTKTGEQERHFLLNFKTDSANLSWSLYRLDALSRLLFFRAHSMGSYPEPAHLLCCDLGTRETRWTTRIQMGRLTAARDRFLLLQSDGTLQVISGETGETIVDGPGAERVLEAHLCKDQDTVIGLLEFGGLCAWSLSTSSKSIFRGTSGAAGPLAVSPDERFVLIVIPSEFAESSPNRAAWVKSKKRRPLMIVRRPGDTLQLWELSTKKIVAQHRLDDLDLVDQCWFVSGRGVVVETRRGQLLLLSL